MVVLYGCGRTERVERVGGRIPSDVMLNRVGGVARVEDESKGEMPNLPVAAYRALAANLYSRLRFWRRIYVFRQD